MAWTDSRVFRAWVRNNMLRDPSGSTPTGYTNLVADTVKAALFNNTVTPDRDALAASAGYNTGAWAAAGEATGGANWPAGGLALTGKVINTSAGGLCTYDAADLPGGGTLTLTDAYGCLIYDHSITGGTVADQGVCYLYFGGAQQVTSGTFTIVFSASGIMSVSA